MQMKAISTANAVQVAPSPDVVKALLKARLMAGAASNFSGMDVYLVMLPRCVLEVGTFQGDEWKMDGDTLKAKLYGCGPMGHHVCFEKVDDDHYFVPLRGGFTEAHVVWLID